MEGDYDFQMKQKVYLPYKMGYLTDWMVELAEEELGETKEIRSQAISELRDLIAEHKELKAWTDDAYLLQFLRARKFDVKKAWELLQHFFVVKGDYPDVYPPELDIESIKTAQEKSNGGGAYPYRDKNGSPIVFVKLGKWDPDQFSMPIFMSAMTFLLLQCIEDPATQVCGIQLIIDAKNTSLKHTRAYSPRYLQLLAKAFRNTLPIRYKHVHVVNESFFFSYLFNIFKLFLSEKIRNRIHFHGTDMKHLHKYIPKEILPPEYDGDNTEYCASEWVKKETYSYLEKYKELHRCGFL